MIIIYLEKFKIVKVAETKVLEYLQLIMGSMEVVCGMLVGLPPFTTIFCILELYHLLVTCLFGNEKLSKTSLAKHRGFGLNEELFSHELHFSALGLKLAFPYFQKFCSYFSGEKKRQSLSLVFSCIYFIEIQNLPDEVASSDLISRLTNLICSNILSISDEATDLEGYLPVSLAQFVNVYCRKFRRNQLKCVTAKILLEAYASSQHLQQALCDRNVVISISHGGQLCTFKSRNINSALTSLKTWLKDYTMDDFAMLWYQYAIKKVDIPETQVLGLSTIDNLLVSSCRETMERDAFDIQPAFFDPDIVARYFELIEEFSYLKYHLHIHHPKEMIPLKYTKYFPMKKTCANSFWLLV